MKGQAKPARCVLQRIRCWVVMVGELVFAPSAEKAMKIRA
jgi:hypothetical protein